MGAGGVAAGVQVGGVGERDGGSRVSKAKVEGAVHRAAAGDAWTAAVSDTRPTQEIL